MLYCMDDDQKRLAVRLGAEFRRLRQDRKLTQEDVAFDARITPTYLSFVETGRTNVTLVKAMQIARALGVRLAEVLSAVENDEVRV